MRRYHILSAGRDYRLKYWDLRKSGPDDELLDVPAHSHWVSAAQYVGGRWDLAARRRLTAEGGRCSPPRYNRFHDQLVLSCGTDREVKLWRAGSCSSTPPVPEEQNTTEEEKELDLLKYPPGEKVPVKVAPDEADGLIKEFDDHDDSVQARPRPPRLCPAIRTRCPGTPLRCFLCPDTRPPNAAQVYSVSWSAADAWIFASLSYEGKVAVNHVPSAEKYKILL